MSRETTRRTSPTTPSKQALSVRKYEQNRIKLGYMDFASEAKMNRLIAGFLRTNGYRVPAKRFAEQAKFNAVCAKACGDKIASPKAQRGEAQSRPLHLLYFRKNSP